VPQENRRCGDCRFAEPTAYSDTKICRRNAPSGVDVGKWPRVLAMTDWCYQFERASGSQPTASRASQASPPYSVIAAGHRKK
jgi:hypothetical protein